MEIMLLNAQHGVLLIKDTILRQQWIQDQCEHFQVITVISKEIHYITYYRRDSDLADAAERMEDLWLQELKMIRPLVDTDNILNPDSTIRSEGTDSPHMVIYTNPSKVRLAVYSKSPDQQCYEDPATAWHLSLLTHLRRHINHHP